MLRSVLSCSAFALGIIAAATPATAGSPCCCLDPCVVPAPPVVVYEPYRMPRIYIVDQGPVYSGPGIYTNPTVVLPRRLPRYPYVGRDYPDDGLPPYEPGPLRARGQVVR